MEKILYVVLSGYERGGEVNYFYCDLAIRSHIMENIVSYLEEEGDQDQISLVENLSIGDLTQKAILFGKKMKQNNQGCWIESVDIFKSKEDGTIYNNKRTG
jgi:hypothetical protein